jgi:acyl transferase domain-containing protein
MVTSAAKGSAWLLLKRLSEAAADQDPIVAVIRGSAVNQDGPSSGLTVPNGPAQQDVIRRALANAQVSADQITYLEAHGTGTSLGDPIEMGALAGVYGSVRTPADPLYVGSVKTNIGHLEGSAGIAAIIKVALMLQHGELPVHLHFQRPSPHIDWSRLPVKVVTQRQAWPVHRPRLAGVSSFGFSGTNAHVILEAAPPLPLAPSADRSTPAPRSLELIALSAKSEASLNEMARRIGEYLQSHPQVSLGDVALTLNVGRNKFPERLTVIAGSTAAAAELFLSHSRGDHGLGLKCGRAGKSAAKTAFLFAPHNRAGAVQAASLYESQSVFRAAIDECAAELASHNGMTLGDVLFQKRTGTSAQSDGEAAWQATFALEYALGRLWQAWGVAPAFVTGQGVGEYAAACVAGVFSAADGMRLAAARCRLAAAQRSEFSLLSIAAAEPLVIELLDETREENLSLAAVNGSEEILVSGDQASLKRLADACRQRGWMTMPLATDDAIPNAVSDSAVSEFRAIADGVTFATPKLTALSSITGERGGPEIATADYWVNALRRPTRFFNTVKSLMASGAAAMLEMGRRPALTMLGQRSLRTDGEAASASSPAWLTSLRPDTPAWTTLLESLAELYLRGTHIDWKQVSAGQNARRCVMPTCVFQRERYWFEAPTAATEHAAWKSYSIAGFEQYVVPGNHETHLLQRNAWLEPMIRLMLNEVG